MGDELATLIDESVEDTFAVSEPKEELAEAKDTQSEKVDDKEKEGSKYELKKEETKEVKVEEPKISKEEAKKQKAQIRINKRIASLTAQSYQAKNELAKYKERFGDLNQVTEPEPVKENYEDEQKYHDDMIKYQTRKEMVEESQIRLADQKRETDLVKFREKLDVEKNNYPDFDEVFESAQNISVTDIMHDTIVNSKNSVALYYYMLKNPDITEAVSAMPETRQLFNLGRISEKVDAQVRAQRAKTAKSQASEPIKPVKGRSSKSAANPSSMTMDEWAAYRKENPI